MRIFDNAHYPFLQWRTRAYVVTAVLLVVGFGAMVMNIMNPRIGSWLKYGVDFTGGTIVQVAFNQPTQVDQIRDAMGGELEISRFGTANEFVIRMPSFQQEVGQDPARQVQATLARSFPANSFQVMRTEAVGPKVGNELQERALLAIVLSLAATLIYLAIRFEWRFAVAATAATTHDILITLGFLAVTHSEISVGTVAALLTVVGYSLNDTIVVFDRIRENLHKPHQGEGYMQLLNRSINETLPRTVLTGGSTIGTLMSLLIFGGPVIRDFVLVLLLGIVIGTFSSIFVASPVLYAIEQKWPHRAKTGSRSGSSTGRKTAVV